MQMQQPQTTCPFFLHDSTRKHKKIFCTFNTSQVEYFKNKKKFQRPTQEEGKLPICNQSQPGMPQLQSMLVLSSNCNILKYGKIKSERLKQMRNALKKK